MYEMIFAIAALESSGATTKHSGTDRPRAIMVGLIGGEGDGAGSVRTISTAPGVHWAAMAGAFGNEGQPALHPA